ncbi:cytochrome P450 [Kutzneria sp. NPDC052558]|uniref:cytochrome P450 n=1 Tax=Kutzneria sp. NPDC052558 TaxID=3364121 RepID=UPI0037C6C3E0
MTSTRSVDTPEFPVARPDSCPFDPDSAFTRLRAEEPVSPVRCPAGMDAWLVSRYEDIRAVLADPRLSSRAASSQHMVPGYDFERSPNPGQIIQLDGEEHSRLRRMLIGEFTVRRMEALRPYIQRITDEHIDAMVAKPEADLVADFALPIPSLVICEMLGVPYADRAAFQDDSVLLLDTETDWETRGAAWQRTCDYIGGLVRQRQAEPRDDLLSRLIARGEETDRPLAMEELVTLGGTLLIAGHETTANMIALSTVALLENPAQLAALQASPEAAVEELMRYLTVIQFGLLRQATEDVTVGGSTVKAGEWLVAAIQSGNRDGEVYADPDTVDLGRQARTHLGFGFGAHQCLGQQLARIELQVALTTLLRRAPGLRLVEPLPLSEFKSSAIIYGLRTLPVTW